MGCNIYVAKRHLYRVDTRVIRLDPGVGGWRKPKTRLQRFICWLTKQ